VRHSGAHRHPRGPSRNLMRRLLFVTAALLAGGITDAIAQGVSFQARGFADFNCIETRQAGVEGFRTGQIVGHVSSSLSDRFTVPGSGDPPLAEDHHDMRSAPETRGGGR